MIAEITQRGQVTIPKTVRDKYSLMHGTEVEVIDLGGSIMLVPQSTAEAVNRMHANFDKIREELVAADVSLDDMMTTLRQIREANE